MRAVVVLGPTGVGKSEFAIKLAKLFDGEIISADSVQVYKGLDIGSAKIKEEKMQGIKHHLIDILPPDKEFSVFEYVEMTKDLIKQITSQNKLPIIVGGTALYVKALKEGYDFGGNGKVEEFRGSLSGVDNENLYEQLKQQDPKRAAEISANDRKKIVRALEILKFGMQPTKKGSDLDLCIISLVMEREKLYEKINLRTDKMLEQGLVKEVQNLLKDKVTPSSQSMQAIGYKETIKYLNGEINFNELTELIKRHTRNYAKRQMTFLRGMGVKMFDVNEQNQAIEYVRSWYEN